MSWLERVRPVRGGARQRVGLAGDRLYFASTPDADDCAEIAIAANPGADSAAGTGADRAADPTTPAWQASLAALGERLAAPTRPSARWRRGLDVVLAGCHVRWKLLELPRGLRKASERNALAAHLLRDSLGDDAVHWRVQVVEQPDGWPTPVCAVDGRLLDQLASSCADAGIALGRVRPYFAAAFDHWRGTIPGHSFWFAVADAGSVSLGLLRHGRWAGLNVRPASGEPAAQIAAMQAQLAIPAGVDALSLPLHLVAPAAAIGHRSAAATSAKGGGDAGNASCSGINLLAPPAHWSESAVRCRLAFGI